MARVVLFASAVLLAAAFPLARAQHGGHTEGETPEGPPQPIVVPLPQNPSTDCGRAVFHEFSMNVRSCFGSIYGRKNPSEACCKGYALYFGLNSTLPSRNCFCVPEVWAEFDSHREMHRYKFADAFLYCRRFGYAIGAAETNGVGYCYGKEPSMAESMAVNMGGSSKKKATTSVERYFAKLDKDGLATVSFVTSIFSAVAFLCVLWPAMFDAAMCCIEYGKQKGATH